ncbi:MAG: DUF192 domain-containing protein [Elusimicrobia bacterium]|nr:DUF192 domain-containing protein [Elusimicrobiota bacterium]MDE2236286.1 DUF192 domain-containing protein [Elusimicrobiota bacterium]MDE2424727.1 DUF192 domain-containing protein [Elusimicrobiota bacterium]
MRADEGRSRARGLLGRSGLGSGEGLLITLGFASRLVPCPTIHTLFMKFPIDALFLDGQWRAVHVVENMPPWRFSAWVPSARSVLELPAGTLRGTVRAGDQVEVRAA